MPEYGGGGKPVSTETRTTTPTTPTPTITAIMTIFSSDVFFSLGIGAAGFNQIMYRPRIMSERDSIAATTNGIR